MIYGLTKGQNEDRQLISMSDYGINHQKIYVDKQSGKYNIGDVHNTDIYFTDGSVEYLLNGGYSKFAGTIGLPYKAKDKKRKNCKNIWDNKLLYSSPIMLGEVKPVKFNIDISNVLNLRIEIDGSAYAWEYVSTMLISIHNKNPLQNKLPVLNNGEFSMLPAYYNQ